MDQLKINLSNKRKNLAVLFNNFNNRPEKSQKIDHLASIEEKERIQFEKAAERNKYLRLKKKFDPERLKSLGSLSINFP